MHYHRQARRGFLTTSGIALAMPWLPSWRASCWAGEAPQSDIDVSRRRRMVAICAPLGIHTPYLFPTSAGKEYEVTPYLEPLQPIRDRFTIASGLMHPMVDGGHSAEKSFLTAAPHPGQPSFRNTISVDQFAAERMGHETRFPSLALSAGNGGISYTRSGVLIPAETRPSRVFAKLFLDGTAAEKANQLRRIRDGQSILDLVLDQATAIQNRTDYQDRSTIDQYLTSVRELEQRMSRSEEWAHKDKPTVDSKPPDDIEDRANFSGRMKLFFDLMLLALRTDSTRLITLKGQGDNEVVKLKGVDDGWHNLSHHGKSPEKLAQLAIIEREEMRLFGEFLQSLAAIDEGDEDLLQRTTVLLGSNLGNASSHNNTNLPIVLAGGKFQHGHHLAFDAQNAPPLSNLFVSLLNHLQIEVDQFASSSGSFDSLL